MSIEEVMNYVAWVIAAAVLAWLVVDALRVEVTYDREILVSSVEGEIEKEILSSDEEAALRRHAAGLAATVEPESRPTQPGGET